MRPMGTSDEWQVSEHAASLVRNFARSRIALHVAASRPDPLPDYHAANAEYCSQLRNLLNYIGLLEMTLRACLVALSHSPAQDRPPADLDTTASNRIASALNSDLLRALLASPPDPSSWQNTPR